MYIDTYILNVRIGIHIIRLIYDPIVHGVKKYLHQSYYIISSNKLGYLYRRVYYIIKIYGVILFAQYTPDRYLSPLKNSTNYDLNININYTI